LELLLPSLSIGLGLDISILSATTLEVRKSISAFKLLLIFHFAAHIAGLTGKQTNNERIDKITGLDPNRVGFNANQAISRLAAGDARYVEVYHSNIGRIGMREHVVDSDVYISKFGEFLVFWF
jgi:Lipase